MINGKHQDLKTKRLHNVCKNSLKIIKVPTEMPKPTKVKGPNSHNNSNNQKNHKSVMSLIYIQYYHQNETKDFKDTHQSQHRDPANRRQAH